VGWSVWGFMRSIVVLSFMLDKGLGWMVGVLEGLMLPTAWVYGNEFTR